MTDLSTPAALEVSGSQWAIQLPDGRVNPTGTGKDRTERDAEWENAHPHGHGGCCAVVRDAYRTPWRLAGASWRPAQRRRWPRPRRWQPCTRRWTAWLTCCSTTATWPPGRLRLTFCPPPTARAWGRRSGDVCGR